jgi:hypothetical protein
MWGARSNRNTRCGNLGGLSTGPSPPWIFASAALGGLIGLGDPGVLENAAQ